MSVYLRKRKRVNGYVYEVIVDKTNSAGKRIRKSKALPVGTKKTEAENIAKRMELEMEFGNYVDKKPITLREYFYSNFLEDYVVVAQLSPTTVKNYKQIFRCSGGLDSFFGDEYVNQITSEKIQSYVRIQMTEYNRSVKTVKNHLGLLSNILHRAKIDKFIVSCDNPVSSVVIPSWERRETQAYTLTEVKEMMRRADNEGNLLVLAIIALSCLGGGLRRSELAGLESSRCYVEKEYNNKAVEICQSVVQVEGGQSVRHCKSKNSVRTVPIGNTLAEIICRVKRANLEKKFKAGKDFAGGDSLLLNDFYPYAPAKPNYIYSKFKEFLRISCPDLPQLRLHDLRATYASIGAELDFKQGNLKKALGHSDISITQKYYIKNFDESLQRDVGKLEEALQKIV